MAEEGTGRCARRIGRLAGVVLGAMGTLPATGQGQGEQPGAGAVEPAAAGGLATPRRVVRVFNFDDARNPDPVPPQWVRTTLASDGTERSGFPKYNQAVLDKGAARSGERSVKLPTAGGSTALRLRPGEVPIFADADYAVAAHVRTEDLTHARAYITARLLDPHLRPIPGSEVRSEPALTGGLWRTVHVHVPGRRANAPGAAGAEAAWLQIDLELLQPRQFEAALGDDPAAKALAKHRVWREDVRGAAWFDDVSVMQIPRATLATASPRNIIKGNEPPTLMLTVRDLGGDELRARVQVRNLSSQVVAEHETPIDPGGRSVAWTPELPGYGWFSARMDVFIADGSAEAVSKADAWFVRIPAAGGVAGAGQATGAESMPASGSNGAGSAAAVRARLAAATQADRARFGLIAEATPEDRWPDLPEVTSRMGTGFIHLPAWQAESTIAGAAASLNARRAAIESLLRLGQTVTLVMTGLPSELVRSTRVPADDALSLAAVDRKEWLPFLAPTLDIFGQRIVRYQIGSTGGDHAFWKDDIGESVEAMRAGLSAMVPGPEIAIPWTADRAWSERADVRSGRVRIEGVTVLVPPGLRPESIESWLGGFDAPVGSKALPPEVTVVLDLTSAERYDGWSRVSDLARRMIEFWRVRADGAAEVGANTENAARPSRLAIAQPWEWGDQPSIDDGPSPLWPKPELAAMATLMDRLSGRRIVGELRSTPGVKCYILAARNAALGTLDRGGLVAWNESAEPSRATVDAAALGAAVTVVDLFGNERMIAAAAGSEAAGAGGLGGASPLVTVHVGEAPVFIEGIDPYLALFAASFRLEPGFMPAVVREHEHRIILTNPWPLRITGKLQLKEDTDRAVRPGRVVTDEWRVSPSGIIDFDMAPGQTLSVPVSLSFGPGQIAGIKDFVIVARAMADRAYPPVRLKATIEVGLADIELNPELQVVGGGGGPGGGSDLVVVAAVTNKGTRPRTLRLETAAKNMPSQQLQISDLPPGQTVLRRFVFKDAAKALSGRRIVISLSDLEEAQRLNKAVLVP